MQGRDLNESDLRRIVRDFLDRAQASGPDTAIAVYLSGYGVQLEGENYLIPVGARIARDSDVALEGFRISDLVRSLNAVPGQVRILMVDAARNFPFPLSGQPLARGLALVEPPPGFLIALSAAPGTVAPDRQGPYGALCDRAGRCHSAAGAHAG